MPVPFALIFRLGSFTLASKTFSHTFLVPVVSITSAVVISTDTNTVSFGVVLVRTHRTIAVPVDTCHVVTSNPEITPSSSIAWCIPPIWWSLFRLETQFMSHALIGIIVKKGEFGL